MRKLRVLYISYDGLTDPLGQSQVLPYLTQLSQLNYEITILSAEKEDNFLKNKLAVQNICSQNGLRWINIKYSKNPPVLSTVRDIKWLTREARGLFENERFDITHCRSYIASIVGLRLKKSLGIKFIFDMRGFWADERIDGEIWNIKNPIFKIIFNIFKKKEKEYLLNSDITISLTYNGKKEIQSWDYMRNHPDNIEVIPCCADLAHFNYKKNKPNYTIREELGIERDNKVICYLGSIGTWYMIDEMLDYFKFHLQKFPKTTFLWITKDNPELIIRSAKIKGVFHKVVIKPSERNELPALLSICDASIFFIKPLHSKKASSPTKMAELLGMGIPLICNTNVGDTDQIVRKEKVGLVLNAFKESEYQKIISQFEDLLTIPKSQLRSTAEKYFSLEEGVRKYAKVYSNLIN
tara:strand:- start:7385 stop:8611 length:1227 start_codon:yes stop_codon:yes gene_type:complete